MVTILEGPFNTKVEAENYIGRLYRSYHPAGYGTHVKAEKQSDGWWVRGSRANSCD